MHRLFQPRDFDEAAGSQYRMILKDAEGRNWQDRKEAVASHAFQCRNLGHSLDLVRSL